MILRRTSIGIAPPFVEVRWTELPRIQVPVERSRGAVCGSGLGHYSSPFGK